MTTNDTAEMYEWGGGGIWNFHAITHIRRFLQQYGTYTRKCKLSLRMPYWLRVEFGDSYFSMILAVALHYSVHQNVLFRISTHDVQNYIKQLITNTTRGYI